MGFLANLGFAGIVNLFLTLWPVITAGIQIAEKANPTPGAGSKKFNDVLNSVTNIAVALPAVVKAVDTSGKKITSGAHTGDMKVLQEGIGEVINVAVRLANAVGAFQKSGFVQGVSAGLDKEPNTD